MSPQQGVPSMAPCRDMKTPPGQGSILMGALARLFF